MRTAGLNDRTGPGARGFGPPAPAAGFMEMLEMKRVRSSAWEEGAVAMVGVGEHLGRDDAGAGFGAVVGVPGP